MQAINCLVECSVWRKSVSQKDYKIRELQAHIQNLQKNLNLNVARGADGVKLLDKVIRRFFGNENVVRMRLLQSGTGHTYKLRFALEHLDS